MPTHRTVILGISYEHTRQSTSYALHLTYQKTAGNISPIVAPERVWINLPSISTNLYGCIIMRTCPKALQNKVSNN